MNYEGLSAKINELPIARRALLEILFFSGCRVSEALALEPKDIRCEGTTIYVEFHRKKGSRDTDPIPLPKTFALGWLCDQEEKIFSFSYKTAYRIVKRIWPDRYPHYFRHNRFTDLAEKFPLATIMSFSGLSPRAIQFYIAKVDIKKVGKALREEIG